MIIPFDPGWFLRLVNDVNRDVAPRLAGNLALRPRLPDKTWRILGMWNDLREFLIVMGISEEDCRSKLTESTRHLTREDVARLDAVWLEEWCYEEWSDRWRWIPTTEIPLHRMRLRAAAFEQHGHQDQAESA